MNHNTGPVNFPVSGETWCWAVGLLCVVMVTESLRLHCELLDARLLDLSVWIGGELNLPTHRGAGHWSALPPCLE